MLRNFNTICARTIGIICLVVLLTGCFINRDLSLDSRYEKVMGGRYLTKVELGVSRFSDSWNVRFSPLNDRQVYPPRENIKPPFPIRYYGTIILGILPAGTEFQVVEVREEGSWESSFVRYKVKILHSADKKWEGKVFYADVVSTEWVPQFKSEYVKKL